MEAAPRTGAFDLVREYAQKKLLDFTITLPDGTIVSVDPPDRMATITVSFTNGRVESMKYSAANAAAG